MKSNRDHFRMKLSCGVVYINLRIFIPANCAIIFNDHRYKTQPGKFLYIPKVTGKGLEENKSVILLN